MFRLTAAKWDVQIASIYDALENLLDKKEDEIEQRLTHKSLIFQKY